MKIAIIYNRESKSVINLFGTPNREKYGLKAIKRISNSLKSKGHQVTAFEGDKDLIDNLENFMPRVMKGEKPGMVFNLSYGIQGQARYTHVPSILEMVGLPYVGSGPLAHSLSLDKVVAKMLFQQHGIPTPEFFVIQSESEIPSSPEFPLIVKPKNESTSFGLKIVKNKKQLLEAAQNILKEFNQPVLVEKYIEGREINVGILGNQNPVVFEPAELSFGRKGPKIYTLDDKRHKSGREIGVICPAKISKSVADKAKAYALQAFKVLGCFDCARVDIRVDKKGNIYILEVNSLPSLGEHGSYVAAAEAMGFDFTALVNELVNVASIRYFGSPKVDDFPAEQAMTKTDTLQFLIKNRDAMEKRLSKWVQLSSRTNDMIGIQHMAREFGGVCEKANLKPCDAFTDNRYVWTWSNKPTIKGGTLLILHFDIPVNMALANEPFRKTPEWLYGEGIGSSRAPITSVEFMLRALREAKLLRKTHLGILCYGDEGNDCDQSHKLTLDACKQAKQAFVLRPGGKKNTLYTQRRGQRRYVLRVEGIPKKMGESSNKPDFMKNLLPQLDLIAALGSREKKFSAAIMDIKTDAFPFLKPHRAAISIHTSFLDLRDAQALEGKIITIMKKSDLRWSLDLISERPSFKKIPSGIKLSQSVKRLAAELNVPLEFESSLWPSVAGAVSGTVPVVCGLGPTAQDLNTTKEAVSRIGFMQRTVLLTELIKQTVS